jgi:hypothetical protein
MNIAEIISKTPQKEKHFKTITKKAIKNSNVFSMLYVLSAFLNIKDSMQNSRIIQIGEYVYKLFHQYDFSNYFLINLLIQWFIETCVKHKNFLLSIISQNKELFNLILKYNKKLHSIDSMKENGIIFSIESLSYYGVLENTMNNKIIDKIFYEQYKERSKVLAKLAKKENIIIVNEMFKESRGIRNFMFVGMGLILQEETFLYTKGRVMEVYRYHVVVEYHSKKDELVLSGKDGKKDKRSSKEGRKKLLKVCALPYDHGCVAYDVQ